MKTVKIKSLKLINFKGQNFEIDFVSNITNVHGENGTGKTTIQDSFTWLLFGKNAKDEADFGIKPWDLNGITIHHLDVEVSGVLLVDNKETVILKRVLHEKWVKPQGEEERIFKGNEMLYYINDSPVQQKEYKTFIDSVISEDLFKLLTNPLYFSASKKYTWQDRRNTIFEIAGNVSDEEIAFGNEKFELLIKELNGKKIEEHKKSISAKKKKIKDDLSEIEPRLKEVNRNIVNGIDFKAIEEQKETKVTEMLSVEKQISSEAEKSAEVEKQRTAIQEKINTLNQNRVSIQNEITLDYQKKSLEIGNDTELLKQTLTSKTNLINNHKRSIKELQDVTSLQESVRKKLLADWGEINASVCDLSKVKNHCPACGQDLPTSSIEDAKEIMQENFNTEKVSKLKVIETEGMIIKIKIDETKKQISDYELLISDLQKVVDETQSKLDELGKIEKVPLPSLAITIEKDERISKIYADVFKLTKEMDALKSETNEELKENKAVIAKELEELNNQLKQRDDNKKYQARIDEIKAEEKSLSNQLTLLEKDEFIIDSFVRAKIEVTEEKISSLFKFTTFKMYDQQIDGVSETCEATFNGVPFQDLNNAKKINVGIDIINTLSNHYNCSAPIFIDNAESVTELTETESQVIRLVVDKECKSLTIK